MASLQVICLSLLTQHCNKLWLQAPGYSQVVPNPMDLTTMRGKLKDGLYKTWEGMFADTELMFNNCMRYNPRDSKYHKQVWLGSVP